VHGFEIPFTLDIPAAIVGDKVTPTDKIWAMWPAANGRTLEKPEARMAKAVPRGRAMVRRSTASSISLTRA
jgi:hypothetical protein